MSGLIKREARCGIFEYSFVTRPFLQNTEQLRQYEIPGPKESHVLLPKLPRMLIWDANFLFDILTESNPPVAFENSLKGSREKDKLTLWFEWQRDLGAFSSNHEPSENEVSCHFDRLRLSIHPDKRYLLYDIYLANHNDIHLPVEFPCLISLESLALRKW